MPRLLQLRPKVGRLLDPMSVLGKPTNGSARSGAGATRDKYSSYSPRPTRSWVAGSFSAPGSQRKRSRLLAAYALCGGGPHRVRYFPL
jgi:hypothetical protein